ncbi:MAG: TetR/AcrR family transcriptional regulator [Pseudorhodoplanes sp.]|nr:TetR/AcrR family transcriptional regulator [Pseudorhodoplanes sp.]
MRKANVQLKSDRRDEILNAARQCFARTGFHQTSMQEICAAAGMSPGNLYRYFPSKEAIIAGIAERDRAEVGAQFAAVENAPDFFATLGALARHHFVERSADEVGLCAEIMSESRRNPAIARIMHEFDHDVVQRLMAMLRSASERGEIGAGIDYDAVVTMLMVIADGVWWRRAVDPGFDAERVLPLFMDITRHMLEGRPAGGRKQRAEHSK